MNLSISHQAAVNRRRRIVVQYDAYSELGADFQDWLAYRFSYVDEPGSQIDALWWDIGGGQWSTWPSTILEHSQDPGLAKWWEQGIDWVGELVAATRRRGLEVFWNHRISEVDIERTGGGLEMTELHPLKRDHPDWVVKCWWWQGLWNLAVPAVREFQLSILQELQQRYRFDGFQLDFARHVPCLPSGRQWELCEHVTEFVRMVRTMLLAEEVRTGEPVLLAVRIPGNIAGCHADGFDVETWAREDLIDIFTLGSRSVRADIAGFQRITAGHNIKLQPCLDDHHATDAYQYPPIEFFRGVFGNWWRQGADSVMTFNWSNAPPEGCAKVGARPGPASQRQAYHEVGSPVTLVGKSKTFVVERRGGYPWAEGFFNRNDDATLPAPLANDGRALVVSVPNCDNVQNAAGKPEVTLRLILHGAREGDEVAACLNGVALTQTVRDPEWKDKLIFSPRPQPASGGADLWQVNPDQQLLRLDFAVPSGLCRVGENEVSVRVAERAPYQAEEDVVVEKVELHVRYREG